MQILIVYADSDHQHRDALAKEEKRECLIASMREFALEGPYKYHISVQEEDKALIIWMAPFRDGLREQKDHMIERMQSVMSENNLGEMHPVETRILKGQMMIRILPTVDHGDKPGKFDTSSRKNDFFAAGKKPRRRRISEGRLRKNILFPAPS